MLKPGLRRVTVDSSPILQEIQRQVTDVSRNVTEIKSELEDTRKTLEGDPKHGWAGHSERLRLIEKLQKEHTTLIEAYLKDEEERKKERERKEKELREDVVRRDRYVRIAVGGLTTISVLLSVLVALSTLTGGP